MTSNSGFIGCPIHRRYRKFAKKADMSIISNSPMVSMLNSFLNSPLMGGMMGDANTKTVRVQGYKGRLEKNRAVLKIKMIMSCRFHLAVH